MRLLLDETLGHSIAAILSDAGHEVVRSSAAVGPGATDQELAEEAASDDRVLVTLDEGFANPVRFDPSASPGVVVVTLPDDTHPDFATLAPIDRMQASVVQTLRAVADLATERYRLQDERTALAGERSGLSDHAAQASAAGNEALAESLLTRRAAIDQQVERLAERIGALSRHEEEIRAAADDLSRRTQQARTAVVLDQAQALIDAAGVRLPDQAEPPTETGADPDEHRVVFTGTVVDPVKDPRYDWILKHRAGEGQLANQLLPTWGSLARELARALSNLITALSTSDPRGRLWVAGVDGVKQYRNSA